MNYQAYLKTGNHYRYCLQPGDATRYEFALTFFDDEDDIFIFDDRNAIFTDEDKIHYIISGIDRREYVTLTFFCPSQGSYEVRKGSLRNLTREFIGYLKGHLPKDVDEYTLIAICLAASVLVDDPTAIEDAAKKMLEVRDGRLFT